MKRRLLDTAPRYGMPDDLYYRARPLLHEPGPIDTRYFLSETGIQVRRGEPSWSSCGSPTAATSRCSRSRSSTRNRAGQTSW